MADLQITVSAQPPAALAVDALVVNIFEGEKPGESTLAALDQKLQGELGRLADLDELPSKLYQTILLPTNGAIAAPRLLLVGSGKRGEFSTNLARNVAGAAVRALLHRPVETAALWIRGTSDGADLAEAVANGAVLATYDPGEYKTTREAPKKHLNAVTILESSVQRANGADAGAVRGRILGEAANFARHLANAPGNILTPQSLAAEAMQAGRSAGFDVDVLDKARMGELGMGALLGVSEGSEQPPATIVMRYRGRGDSDIDLALIGKGVTFDTGGISIKPATDMHLMKEDMAGAAATIGALVAIARLGLKQNVLGVVPAVENMPSGHAMRPGDVLTALNGKTIEVLNTDAEGRLILADAICYAQQLGARRLVDAATLTGAVVIALGHEAAAVLGSPQNWVDQVMASANAVGERVWQLPLFDEYLEQLKSQVADVANVGGRAAGTITAAKFLQQFVNDGVAWAHFDIAGTAWLEREVPYLAKGPTGFPLRGFVELARQLEKSASRSPTVTERQ